MFQTPRAIEEEQRTLIRVINRAGSDHLVFALVTEDVDYQALGLGYATDLRRLTEDGASIRDTTVQHRLTAYQRIRAKAQVYADLLGLRQHSLQTEIRELESQVRRLLLREVRPARAQQDLPDAAENEVVGSSRVCLELKDANSRFCLRPAEVDGVNFICVVMPMRE